MGVAVSQFIRWRNHSLLRYSLCVALLVGGMAQTSQARAGERLEEEVYCLALNIYHEARGEPVLGMRAVAHVVMNRVSHPRFPNSACKVVRQGGERRRHRCQFSWWCDGRPDQPLNQAKWEESVDMAYEIYVGSSQDPTRGALWYHADYVAPKWRKAFLPVRKIGQHIFYLRGSARNKKAKRANVALDG